MSIDTQLFQGEHIRLGAIDYEKDPAVESGWTHTSACLHMPGTKLARPLEPKQVKRRYQAIEGVRHRESRRWDWHYMGILKEEWTLLNNQEEGV